MTEPADDFELTRGSGNVFADLGLPDPELDQLRAILNRPNRDVQVSISGLPRGPSRQGQFHLRPA